MKDDRTYRAMLRMGRLASKQELISSRLMATDLATRAAKGERAQALAREMNDDFLKLQLAIVLQDRSMIRTCQQRCIDLLDKVSPHRAA